MYLISPDCSSKFNLLGLSQKQTPVVTAFSQAEPRTERGRAVEEGGFLLIRETVGRVVSVSLSQGM